MQTVKLVGYGQELGWKDDTIIVKIENKRKDGKWRAASGTLRIDQREGLQSVVGLIEADECKAVMVWAVDRLFRHEDMVEPAVFVRICKEHHCIILTPDDFFDFSNPKRDDRRRFLELAQQAADYVIKHVKGRMIPA
jgi:DNA invertase Pin-like site-specific DNA recombinase